MSLDKSKKSKIPKKLVESVKKGDCILFIGAGVHAAPPENSEYKYPLKSRPLLGQELVEAMAEECDFEKEFPKLSKCQNCGEMIQTADLDLQRVSLYYEINENLGRSELVDFLKENVQKGKQPSPALKMLAALPFKIIITTNYDSLFEKALVKERKKPKNFVYNPKAPVDGGTPDFLDGDPTDKQPMLFKMHGDIEERSSIVITDEDYINFVQRMSQKETVHPVPHTIRFRMKHWPILFVGYSLQDYNLRLLFRTLRWKVDEVNFKRSFSIDMDPDPLIMEIWQRQNRYITFVTENLWAFVPALYKEVKGKDYPA